MLQITKQTIRSSKSMCTVHVRTFLARGFLRDRKKSVFKTSPIFLSRLGEQCTVNITTAAAAAWKPVKTTWIWWLLSSACMHIAAST